MYYIYMDIYIWSNIELVEECTCYVLLYYIEILDDWCIIYIYINAISQN